MLHPHPASAEPSFGTQTRDNEEHLHQEGLQLFEQLQSFGSSIPYGAGDQIIFAEEEANNLYFIQEGSVEVSYTIEGTRIIVALIGAGNFLGEIGFFDGVSRIRNIHTRDPSVLHIFDQRAIADLKKINAALYIRLLEFLSRSICLKFRRILEEREPMTAYAASLSTGKKRYHESIPLSKEFFQTSIWEKINVVVEDFKAGFFDLSHRLQQIPDSVVPEDMENQGKNILRDFLHQLENLEEEVAGSDFHDQVWGYLFKEIYPYFLRSRFAERAYYKPKGYAGDFLMMEMIYKNAPQGDGKIGWVVDRFCLDSIASKAVRGRRRLLTWQIQEEFQTKGAGQDRFQVMNLACGSNRELFDFIKDCSEQARVDALCVDADTQALEYSHQLFAKIGHSAALSFMSENLVKWSLGRVRQDFGTKDLIYSAGLTDYLEDRLFSALVTRCHAHLKPGGVLIIGNFGPDNREKTFMERILHWKLIHRNSDNLQHLFASSADWEEVQVLQEDEGVNLFVKARK